MLGTLLSPSECSVLTSEEVEELSAKQGPENESSRYTPASFTGSVLLPVRTRRTPKLTVVLDLDETLVHAELAPKPYFNDVLTLENGGSPVEVYVGRRPNLLEFLTAASETFELVLFTASQEVYADQVLNFIDPNRKLLRHRLFRDSCVFHNGLFVKDLRCLGRDLRHVVLVDNNPGCFLFQPHNGIPISSWYGSQDDCELDVCLRFLYMLSSAEDVRPVLRQVCNFDPEAYLNHSIRTTDTGSR